MTMTNTAAVSVRVLNVCRLNAIYEEYLFLNLFNVLFAYLVLFEIENFVAHKRQQTNCKTITRFYFFRRGWGIAPHEYSNKLAQYKTKKPTGKTVGFCRLPNLDLNQRPSD